MSMFSDIVAERDREIVAKAIDKAQKELRPQCTDGEYEKVQKALQIVKAYCDYHIQE